METEHEDGFLCLTLGSVQGWSSVMTCPVVCLWVRPGVVSWCHLSSVFAPQIVHVGAGGVVFAPVVPVARRSWTTGSADVTTRLWVQFQIFIGYLPPAGKICSLTQQGVVTRTVLQNY